MQLKPTVISAAAIWIGALALSACSEPVDKPGNSETGVVLSEALPDEEYYIVVEATEISSTAVELKAATNIPIPVEVVASIYLHGQEPNDVYVGHSQRVTIKSLEQTIVVNHGAKNLPSGTYVAEVDFHSRWGAMNGNPAAAKIGTNIVGAVEIDLVASGETMEVRLKRDKLRRWIMEDIVYGEPWSEQLLTSKLGKYDPVPIRERNPNVIKGMHFPSADMTIFVNVFLGENVSWSLGRDESK